LEDGYYIDFNVQNESCFIYELNGGNGVLNGSASNLNILKSVFFAVRIECNNDSIKVYLNNSIIISATSNSFDAGHIGIRSYGNECYFDNIKITKI